MFDATGKNHAAVQTPRTAWWPRASCIHVSKPHLGIPGPAPAAAAIGRHTFSFGAYFANYTQDNHWFFTQILTDVARQPHFLDAVVTPPGGTPDSVTKNGFREPAVRLHQRLRPDAVVSGVLGGEIQITERLRADVGGRVEYDNFVQSSENTSTFDLDGDSTTTFNNETFGNGSFRHFDKSITDWAASMGLNYRRPAEPLALSRLGARGYKMPALDEFLNAHGGGAGGPVRVAEVQSVEGGVKGAIGRSSAFTVNGF